MHLNHAQILTGRGERSFLIISSNYKVWWLKKGSIDSTGKMCTWTLTKSGVTCIQDRWKCDMKIYDEKQTFLLYRWQTFWWISWPSTLFNPCTVFVFFILTGWHLPSWFRTKLFQFFVVSSVSTFEICAMIQKMEQNQRTNPKQRWGTTDAAIWW